jgi:hypothetical protein
MYILLTQNLGASNDLKGVFLGKWLQYFEENGEFHQEEASGENKMYWKWRLSEAETSSREEINHSEFSGVWKKLWLL